MSDLLLFWAADQTWGGPLDKIAMLYIATQTKDHGGIAYGVTEDGLIAWSGMGRGQARAALKRLQNEGHIVLVCGREGPGFMIAAIYREERLVLRFGGR